MLRGNTLLINGEVVEATYVPASVSDDLTTAKSAIGVFSNDGVFSSSDLYLTIPTKEAYAAPSLEGTFSVSLASAM